MCKHAAPPSFLLSSLGHTLFATTGFSSPRTNINPTQRILKSRFFVFSIHECWECVEKGSDNVPRRIQLDKGYRVIHTFYRATPQNRHVASCASANISARNSTKTTSIAISNGSGSRCRYCASDACFCSDFQRNGESNTTISTNADRRTRRESSVPSYWWTGIPTHPREVQ